MEERKPLPIEIDYSEAFPPVDDFTTAQANWEPPPHVYYGKRMPNGKSEKEPTYVYQEFPRMLYKPINGKLRAKVVNDTATKQAMLDDGWGLTPADFGVETCPGRDTITAPAPVADRSVVKPVSNEEIEAAIPEMIVPTRKAKPSKKTAWTPERRAAARERTLAILEEKKRKAAAQSAQSAEPAPTAEPAPAAEPAPTAETA